MQVLEKTDRNVSLRVLKADDCSFYVDSSGGDIAYKCSVTKDIGTCTCKDFELKSRNISGYRCKHLMAVNEFISNNQEIRTPDRKRPKLDERFITTIDNKEFVLMAGLLDLSHQKGLISIEVDLLQVPLEENQFTAICKATSKTADGSSFSDIGDANPQNTNSKISKHICRLASSRAICRSLRSLTNVGMTALEELGDISEVIGTPSIPGNVIPRTDNVKTLPTGRKPRNIRADLKGVTAANPDIQGSSPTANNAATETKNSGGNTYRTPPMSLAQKNAIAYLSKKRNIPIDELDNMTMRAFSLPLESLSTKQASLIIQDLQKTA